MHFHQYVYIYFVSPQNGCQATPHHSFCHHVSLPLFSQNVQQAFAFDLIRHYHSNQWSVYLNHQVSLQMRRNCLRTLCDPHLQFCGKSGHSHMSSCCMWMHISCFTTCTHMLCNIPQNHKVLGCLFQPILFLWYVLLEDYSAVKNTIISLTAVTKLGYSIHQMHH